MLPEDRATATGSMHKKLVNIACCSEDMIADRQTRSAQYSAPLSGAELIILDFSSTNTLKST